MPGATSIGSAASRSASSKTSCGDLPPSSSVTGTTLAAAAAWISRPTASEPVKERWSMPGCAASAAPASSPRPGTTLSAPGGRPASTARRGEGERGQARLLGRLQHAGVAGGERGDDRAADDLHRVVPGDDVPGDAVRLAQGVDGVAGEIRDGLARQLVGGAAVELEVARQRPGVGAGLAERLADVAAPRAGRGPRTRSSTSRPSRASSRPRSAAVARPHGAVEGGARRRDGGVDLGRRRRGR